ncbi:hypothetical protein BMS3Abin15_00901 [bacterium BMS3Abin15]|nr:hypothetical protein BMS3Abin15_00901 [bacterium BMS3Abin15]HDH07588.1 hypothetical protein [Candidatus Moranbacteria bacterium]HDZ85452.1 hypothetical protein [Candidatus Moranbacteria bacterium]
MNKSRLTLLVFTIILLFFVGMCVVQAQGEAWDPANYGNYGLPEGRIYDIVEKIMMWILSIIGIIAIIAFSISGIQYLTSAGNETAIETAKRNMKWSIYGVITALAGLIILQEVTALLDGCFYILPFVKIC